MYIKHENNGLFLLYCGKHNSFILVFPLLYNTVGPGGICLYQTLVCNVDSVPVADASLLYYQSRVKQLSAADYSIFPKQRSRAQA